MAYPSGGPAVVTADLVGLLADDHPSSQVTLPTPVPPKQRALETFLSPGCKVFQAPAASGHPPQTT
jgi:hypothetical protein